MNEILRRLQELEVVDNRIAVLRAEMAELPKKLEAVAASREQAKARVADAEQRLSTTEHERRDQEGELQLENERLSKYKKQLYQIKTNQEYETMLHEIAGSEKRIGEIEERVLLAMEGVDETTRAVAESRRAFQEASRVCDEEEAALRAAWPRSSGRPRWRKPSGALAPAIDAATLARYEQIRARRGGVAVIEARQGTCQGCRVQLPPQLYNELFRGVEMLTCQSCQRILYVVHRPEEAKAT
jgi:predicted  nucleic acid-binding Zn-ribbon protein